MLERLRREQHVQTAFAARFHIPRHSGAVTHWSPTRDVRKHRQTRCSSAAPIVYVTHTVPNSMMDENVKNVKNEEHRPPKPSEDPHEWCSRCSQWIQTKVWKQGHSANCAFGQNVKAPHVPKVLLTDDDWEVSPSSLFPLEPLKI